MLVPFVGAHLHAFAGDTVICSLKADNFFFVCMYGSHLHGEIVCLGSRVHKGHHTQFFGENFEQLMSTGHQLIINEPGVC